MCIRLPGIISDDAGKKSASFLLREIWRRSLQIIRGKPGPVSQRHTAMCGADDECGAMILRLISESGSATPHGGKPLAYRSSLNNLSEATPQGEAQPPRKIKSLAR